MSALAVLALALQATAAEPASAPPAPAPAPKLFVLAFKDNGVGADVVGTIGETLVAHLSANPRVQVTSSEDVRRILEEQATKLELGCNTDSCMSEIAGALGAQLTLYGTAGKLGDVVIVTMSLFDARAGKSIGRETVEVASLADLPGPLRAAGDRLIARLEPARGPSSLMIGGASLSAVGVVAAIVGAALWLPNIDGYQDDGTFEEKSRSRAAENGGAALAAVGAGALVVGGALIGLSLAFE